MPLGVKRGKIFVSLLLQNESIMLVSNFPWHYDEACLIRFDNIKTTPIVKKALKGGGFL